MLLNPVDKNQKNARNLLLEAPTGLALRGLLVDTQRTCQGPGIWVPQKSFFSIGSSLINMLIEIKSDTAAATFEWSSFSWFSLPALTELRKLLHSVTLSFVCSAYSLTDQTFVRPVCSRQELRRSGSLPCGTSGRIQTPHGCSPKQGAGS